MHVPNKFKETNVETLHTLIRSHPLGTWIAPTGNENEFDVNHIPFVLDNTHGEYGVLQGHVNRANPIWKSLVTEKNSVVVFQGAETYITPSWYASKHEHGKAVPTWNYVVVHAHGNARVISDKDWLLEHLNALTDGQELNQSQPWKVSDAPKDFTERMLKGIVGIEIPICTLLGTWKTSQNKQQSDKEGVINGLNLNDDSNSKEMASYVSQHTP